MSDRGGHGTYSVVFAGVLRIEFCESVMKYCLKLMLHFSSHFSNSSKKMPYFFSPNVSLVQIMSYCKTSMSVKFYNLKIRI